MRCQLAVLPHPYISLRGLEQRLEIFVGNTVSPYVLDQLGQQPDVRQALCVEVDRAVAHARFEEGDITEWDIARVLVKHYKLPFLPLSRYSISREVLSLFPVALLRQHTMIPMDRFGNTVTISLGRNPEPGLKDQILSEFNLFPSFFVSTLTDVKNALNLHFPTPFSEFDGLLTDVKKSFQEIGDWDIDEEK